MHDPGEPHLVAIKRILCYIQGTLELGFHLHRTSHVDLIVYSDADWARCLETRRSTSGLRSVRRPSPDPVLRLSIALLPMGLRRQAGYDSFSRNSIALFDELQLCIVTMSVLFIYLPTPFSISGPSMSR